MYIEKEKNNKLVKTNIQVLGKFCATNTCTTTTVYFGEDFYRQCYPFMCYA